MRMAPGSLLGRFVKMGTKCLQQHLCAVGAPSSMCTLAGIVPGPPEPMSSCQQPLIWGGIKSILLLPLAVGSPGRGGRGWGFTPGPDESGYDNNAATAMDSGKVTGADESKQGAPSIGGECWCRGTCSLPDTEPEETKQLLQPSSHHTRSEDGANEAEPEQRGSETRS